MSVKFEHKFDIMNAKIHLGAEKSAFIEASKIIVRSKKVEEEISVIEHIKRLEHFLMPEIFKRRE